MTSFDGPGSYAVSSFMKINENLLDVSKRSLAIPVATVILLLLKMSSIDIDNGGPITEDMINQQWLKYTFGGP